MIFDSFYHLPAIRICVENISTLDVSVKSSYDFLCLVIVDRHGTDNSVKLNKGRVSVDSNAL